jgi:hypothetical protein
MYLALSASFLVISNYKSFFVFLYRNYASPNISSSSTAAAAAAALTKS